MKKLILYVFLIVFSVITKGQIKREEKINGLSIILNARIEATYIERKTFFSLGSKLPINDNNYISLRGHFNWWDLPERKFIVIPELDYFYKIVSFEKNNKGMIKSLYTGAGVTPNTISPKFGVNFYYFFTAELGYDYEFTPYKHFSTEGFRFSFGINLVY